jgi:HAD superfamily hydrolase (TIGR01509 family)
MLKAVLFDCDGVIADSEQLHFELFRKVLQEDLGLDLSKEEYLDKYLAMDDRGCFTSVCRDRGRPLADGDLSRLIQRKTVMFKQIAARNLVILPGVVEFVMAVAQKYPLAVASGALKDEVLLALSTAGLTMYFDAVVAAEDVENGKPAPDAYLQALAEINKKYPGKNIQPSECLVVEDSKHGIASARAAGMKCLAVCTSYAAGELSAADLVAPLLTAVRMPDVEALFQ